MAIVGPRRPPTTPGRCRTFCFFVYPIVSGTAWRNFGLVSLSKFDVNAVFLVRLRNEKSPSRNSYNGAKNSDPERVNFCVNRECDRNARAVFLFFDFFEVVTVQKRFILSV